MSEGITGQRAPLGGPALAALRVDQRFTNALKPDDAALFDPGRRWRERRDRD